LVPLIGVSRDGEKTQHGIETVLWSKQGARSEVATERKPSTGLKLPAVGILVATHFQGRDGEKTQHGIETTSFRRRPTSTAGRDGEKTQHGIETRSMCKPVAVDRLEGRDGEKTQHGIETGWPEFTTWWRWVATERKPSTGLKRVVLDDILGDEVVATERKPSTGLKLRYRRFWSQS